MHCCDATASSFVAKVWGKVFAHFHAVAMKHHGRTQNWLLGLSWWILCEQSPWCQRKLWESSWLLLFTCLTYFGPSEFELSIQTPLSDSCFLSWMLVYSMPMSNCTFSEFSTEFDTQSLLDTIQNCIRPDSQLQTKGHNKFGMSLTPKIC
jgi:hypothetical protein